jgi:hypothetical protein
MGEKIEGSTSSSRNMHDVVDDIIVILTGV